MTLGRLIQILENMDPKKVIYNGFGEPHSYRGYYDQVSFRPMGPKTVKELLKSAKSAVGKTFGGWKGGEFQMTLGTDVWFAEQGNVMEQDHSPSEVELAHMLDMDPDDLGVIHRETTSTDHEGFIVKDVRVPKKFKGRDVEVIVRLK